MLTKPSPNSKQGFTLVEMLVVVPIAMVLMSVLVYALISMTNGATVSNERTVRMAALTRALDLIEQDVAVSNQFLHKASLRDHTGTVNESFIATTDLNNPQLSESVRCGNLPKVEIGGVCRDGDGGQPRLILNRLATITAPDAEEKIKILARFKAGSFISECKYNPPVFFNVVYFVHNGNLYRRNIFPRTRVAGKMVFDENLFCKWEDTSAGTGALAVSRHLPWQKPSCSAANRNNSNKDYCQEEDLLILPDAEIEIAYFGTNGNAISNADIYNNDASKSQDALNAAQGVKIILKSKVALGREDAPQIVSGELIVNKLSDLP